MSFFARLKPRRGIIKGVERRNYAFLTRVIRQAQRELATEYHPPRRVALDRRVLFISDLHLGSQSCHTSALLAFLQKTDAETIYLVGDVFDMWVNFRRQWKPIHSQILKELLRKSRSGRRVVFVPGNHDDLFRQKFRIVSGFEVETETVYTTRSGKRYWVAHGDIADQVKSHGEVISFFASHVEHFFRNVSRLRNFIAKETGWNPSDLVDRVVYKFNQKYTSGDLHRNFLLDMAREKNCEGVICGHFHKPENLVLEQGHYVNCGDWIDHCSAAFEDESGNLRVKSFAPRRFVSLKAHLVPDFEDLLALQA